MGRVIRVGAMLLLAMLIGAFLAAGPVSGHVGDKVGHLWKKHLKSNVRNLALETRKVTVRDTTATVNDGFNSSLLVMCEAGERALGGGSELTGGTIAGFWFFGDDPVVKDGTSTPVGWHDSVFNDSGTTNTWRVYAICAS